MSDNRSKRTTTLIRFSRDLPLSRLLWSESVDYKAYINFLEEEVGCSAIDSLVRSEKVEVSDNN